MYLYIEKFPCYNGGTFNNKYLLYAVKYEHASCFISFSFFLYFLLSRVLGTMLQMEKETGRAAVEAAVQVHVTARVEVAHVAEVTRKRQMIGTNGVNHLRGLLYLVW